MDIAAPAAMRVRRVCVAARAIFLMAATLLAVQVSHAATITIQVNITSDGDIFLTPDRVKVADGDRVRWRVSANIPGAADTGHQGFSKWGHVKERYPATGNPFGLAQTVSRHSWIASDNSTATVGGAVAWPAGVSAYRYTFQFEKPATATTPEYLGAATGTLLKTPNPAAGPTVAVLPGNTNPVVRRDSRGNFWTTSLHPFPPPLITPAVKRADIRTLARHILFKPARGWSFVDGPALKGEFRITRYSAFESRNAVDRQTAAEDCNTAANHREDNCFTVHWIGRDPAVAGKNLHWVQLVCTNKSASGSDYDCPPMDDTSWTIDGSPANTATVAGAIPFFKTPDVMRINTSPAGDLPVVLTFRDKPMRNFPGPDEAVQHVTWLAHLYVADWDEANKKVTLHDGIAWGFTIRCEGTTQNRTVYKSGGAAAYMPSRDHPEKRFEIAASGMPAGIVEEEVACPAPAGKAEDG